MYGLQLAQIIACYGLDVRVVRLADLKFGVNDLKDAAYIALLVDLRLALIGKDGELKTQPVVCYNYIFLQTVEKQHDKGNDRQHDDGDDERRACLLALSPVKFLVV